MPYDLKRNVSKIAFTVFNKKLLYQLNIATSCMLTLLHNLHKYCISTRHSNMDVI